MDLKQIITIINQISKERGIDAARVLGGVEDSLAAAYRKEYGGKGEVIRAKINADTGEVQFSQVKEVVDETTVRASVADEQEEGLPVSSERHQSSTEEIKEGEEKLPRFNSERHILLEEAKKEKKDVVLGDKLEFPLESKLDFGRIAAQSAKQVILQKFREAEREAVFNEFKDKEGKIISGIIHRFDRGNVHVDMGRISGIMFANETIPGERYTVNNRMRFYVVAIQENRRGQPEIVLSRSHPKLVAKLFELEVPEIADGTVVIKGIAREAGSRAKVAVHSDIAGVDPIGSCVGQRGTRVMAITNELGNEKIDIVEWMEKPEEYISASLSPAKIKEVQVFNKREARVIVPEDQLSLAIGKGGQNVRLAAKLTGWKIDVRSEINPSEIQEGGVAESSDPLTDGLTDEVFDELADEAVNEISEPSESPEEGVLIPKPEEE